MRPLLLLSLLLFCSCKLLTTAGKAMGIVPDGLEEEAAKVDTAVFNWLWGLLGIPLLEATPLKPLRRSVRALRRLSTLKKSGATATRVAPPPIVKPGAS